MQSIHRLPHEAEKMTIVFWMSLSLNPEGKGVPFDVSDPIQAQRATEWFSRKNSREYKRERLVKSIRAARGPQSSPSPKATP